MPVDCALIGLSCPCLSSVHRTVEQRCCTSETDPDYLSWAYAASGSIPCIFGGLAVRPFSAAPFGDATILKRLATARGHANRAQCRCEN